MTTIQPLPEDVVQSINAGEVIDSLAAVVRELAENAIDAGAQRLVITVWPEQWRVQLVDNGRGLTPADLQLAAQAHSTSKIRAAADLWRIHSLGFRGEALHSIARLAQLEIFSRSQETGWQVVYDHDGQVVRQTTAAMAPGTVVDVKNLFANWLPRREGLTNTAQQMKAIQALVGQMALCHPQVQWQVYQGEKLWFQIQAAPTARQILPQILPRVRPEDLRQVVWETTATPEAPGGQIELLLGLPDRCHRHRPDWIKVAVNGRLVVAPELEQALVSGLIRTLPRDRYPVCFLHLYLNPASIDWNRHPAKTEIYLHQMAFWQEQVKIAIEKILRLHGPQELGVSTKVTQLLTTAESGGSYQLAPDPGGEESAPGLGLKAVAQLLNTYIVAEHPTGMWLVEQHIAHERVLFEQVVATWQLQQLDTPLLLTDLQEKQVERLEQLGLEIDRFGADTWAVRRVPEPLADRSDLAAAILELSWGSDLLAAQVAIACRCAIRNGTPMELGEMQTLLNRWQATRNPRTCPHGRPIYLAFPEVALARSFRRHWVVGKSHGI